VTNDVTIPKRIPIVRPPRLTVKKAATASSIYTSEKYIKIKKALKETQTLHAGCNKAEPKIFTPPQTPFPGHGMAKI